MKKRFLFAIIALICSCIDAEAQGCSDAGFCSIGNSFKNDDEVTKNNIEFGTVFAGAEEDVTVFSQYITYTHDFNSKFSMNLKLTSAIANGNYGTRGNIGDAYISGNYKLKSASDTKKWALLFGLKIPFTAGNDKINGFSLPMVYQSSLGTFDAIGGVNYSYKKWDFNAAVQIPLSQNKNSFLGTDAFSATNLYERNPDALLRATYLLKSKNEKFSFRPNLLFIYHLGEDSFEDIFAQRQKIKGSDGVTINANVIINYKLNSKSSLETSIAFPFVVRDERPDGLTRSYTLGLAYKVNF
jgi:hypothetical protein